MENNNIRDNGEIQLSDVFPNINKSDGKGTLIRHRRKSSRKGAFGEVDYDSEEDDGNTLPSQRAIQRNRTKSIKVSSHANLLQIFVLKIVYKHGKYKVLVVLM